MGLSGRAAEPLGRRSLRLGRGRRAWQAWATLRVLDEALAPIDREVFRRQVDYTAQINTRNTPTPSPTEKTR